MSGEEDTIPNEETLFRRVLSGSNAFSVVDGELRISSTAFADRSMQPSVDRSSRCLNGAIHTQRTADNGVLKLPASAVRGIVDLKSSTQPNGVEVIHAVDVVANPLEAQGDQPANPAHALVTTTPQVGKSPFRRLLERLSLLACWEIRPLGARDPRIRVREPR